MSVLDLPSSLITIEAKRYEVTDFEAEKLAQLYDQNLISKQQLLSLYKQNDDKLELFNTNIQNDFTNVNGKVTNVNNRVDLTVEKIDKTNDDVKKINEEIPKINEKISTNQQKIFKLASQVLNESNLRENAINCVKSELENHEKVRNIDFNSLLNLIIKENKERINSQNQVSFDFKKYVDSALTDTIGGINHIKKEIDEINDKVYEKNKDLIIDHNKKFKANIAELNQCYIGDNVRIVNEPNKLIPIEIKHNDGSWQNISEKILSNSPNSNKLIITLLITITVISLIIGISLLVLLSGSTLKLFIMLIIISLLVFGSIYFAKNYKSFFNQFIKEDT
jgi:predicted  nucleic acid-binding Zn-ribbon protein